MREVNIHALMSTSMRKCWSSFPGRPRSFGNSPGIVPMLDDSRQPVDKEVFMRALRYYEIRSETKP